jgi:hypothetical protein
MGANCYLCERSYDTINGQSPGDAVGACKLCGVFACLAHGMRNANDPAYVCGCCLPNLLTVAALWHLRSGGVSPQGSPGDRQPSPESPSGFAQWAPRISKLDDVITDIADEQWAEIHQYIEYLLKLLVDRDGPTALRAFAGPDAVVARNLMAAAIAIATKWNLPSHEMHPMLQQAMQAAVVNRYG